LPLLGEVLDLRSLDGGGFLLVGDLERIEDQCNKDVEKDEVDSSVEPIQKKEASVFGSALHQAVLL
jgi:hypothetical protein